MNIVATGIYNALAGGTVGNGLTALLSGGKNSIYYIQAPDNAALDYVVYSIQAGGDMNITPSRMKEYYYYIRGYSKVSAKQAGLIDIQLDLLLHGVSITVTGWSHVLTARVQDIPLVDITPSQQKIYSCGGVYRIILDS